MVLKSLLFAMLLSDAAGGCGLGTPPHACKPRLRGTAQRNSSDVNGTGHESASPDDIIERAAVSNQFNPGPRPGASRTLVVPAASRAMNQNPDPDSNDARVPSPQARIVKMPQAVYGIWPILLLWSPHGPRMLQVE